MSSGARGNRSRTIGQISARCQFVAAKRAAACSLCASSRNRQSTRRRKLHESSSPKWSWCLDAWVPNGSGFGRGTFLRPHGGVDERHASDVGMDDAGVERGVPQAEFDVVVALRQVPWASSTPGGGGCGEGQARPASDRWRASGRFGRTIVCPGGRRGSDSGTTGRACPRRFGKGEQPSMALQGVSEVADRDVDVAARAVAAATAMASDDVAHDESWAHNRRSSWRTGLTSSPCTVESSRTASSGRRPASDSGAVPGCVQGRGCEGRSRWRPEPVPDRSTARRRTPAPRRRGAATASPACQQR